MQSPLCLVIGCRPDIIKLRPLLSALQEQGVPFSVVHAGQHQDHAMSDVFLAGMEQQVERLPLERGEMDGGTYFQRAHDALASYFGGYCPRTVVVYGDTLGALAAGVAAKRWGIQVVHIEAGLRSFDLTMPEEMVRLTLDAFADVLFCPTDRAMAQLEKEQVRGVRRMTGNLVADAVVVAAQRWKDNPTPLPDAPFLLVTLHRPANVDDYQRFAAIADWLCDFCRHNGLQAIWPVHPRIATVQQYNLAVRASVLLQIAPLNHVHMLAYMQAARFIVTDSGGLQEEAVLLGKKCVTIRPNTERPETIEWDVNMLVDPQREDSAALTARVCQHLATPVSTPVHPYGVQVGQKMASLLAEVVQ